MVSNRGSLTATTNPFSSSNDQLRARVNQLSVLSGLQPLATPAATAIDPNLIGGYPQSLTNLGSNRVNNFRVGVAINLPLHHPNAQGQIGPSLGEGKRIATQREQIQPPNPVERR